MTQQIEAPVVVEDDLRVQTIPEAPAPEQRRPSEVPRRGTVWLFVLAAFVVAVAFGAWLATRGATADLAPSAHDSVIGQMLRERQPSAGTASGHDALINQLLRQRQAAVGGTAQDGWAARLGQLQGSGTASGHDALINQLLRERQGAVSGTANDGWASRLGQQQGSSTASSPTPGAHDWNERNQQRNLSGSGPTTSLENRDDVGAASDHDSWARPAQAD